MSQLFRSILLLTGLLALIACSRGEEPSAGVAPLVAASGPIAISVTEDGFAPALAKVRVGQPVTLVVTRKVEKTCATDIVIKDYGISKPLPMDQPVAITFTPTKAGDIRYACAMDMVVGKLVAE